MAAVCPNDPEHKTFLTVAHVMQDWLVDPEGEHIETKDECLQVSFKPDPGNLWHCATCGADAVHE